MAEGETPNYLEKRRKRHGRWKQYRYGTGPKSAAERARAFPFHN